MWQDYALTTILIIVAISVFPMIFDRYTPPYKTSIINVLASIILSVVNLSLGMIFAFVVQIILAGLWTILIFQRFSTS